MDKYSVILYPRAFRDIDEIYAYIALEKMSPENAKGQNRVYIVTVQYQGRNI